MLVWLTEALVWLTEVLVWLTQARVCMSAVHICRTPAAALDVQVTPSDIEISHKLKRKIGANVIIAKFYSHKIKTKLYKQRTKLKNLKSSDLFPGYAAAAARFNNHLFINENLTSYRRGLVDSANRKRRWLHIQYLDNGW